MIETYFTKIRYQILKCLEEATEEILVAVYWFTNTDLFNQLCLKLSEGISVELIICNDSINNRPTGLDFQHFIELGGKLFFSDSEKPMHNKFCIIDKKTLINGSYNWTYFAEIKNYENILIIQDDISTLNKFDVEFRKLKDGLFQVKEYYKSSTSSSSKVQTFDKLSFLLEDLISEAQEKDIPELLEEALNLKSNFYTQNESLSLQNKKTLKSSIGIKSINNTFINIMPKGTTVPNETEFIVTPSYYNSKNYYLNRYLYEYFIAAYYSNDGKLYTNQVNAGWTFCEYTVNPPQNPLLRCLSTIDQNGLLTIKIFSTLNNKLISKILLHFEFLLE